MIKPKEFNYYNPNPTGSEKTGDCVIRAFSGALNISWDDCYKRFCDLGYEIKCMPNDRKCIETFAKRNNFIKHIVSNKKGSKRGTVLEFCKKNKSKTYILNLAGHIVCAKDGKFHDTWNCGNKSLYGIWELVPC
jgi:hypothetical protein